MSSAQSNRVHAQRAPDSLRLVVFHLAELWHHELSAGRTVGLVASLGAAVALTAGASAFTLQPLRSH